LEKKKKKNNYNDPTPTYQIYLFFDLKSTLTPTIMVWRKKMNPFSTLYGRCDVLKNKVFLCRGQGGAKNAPKHRRSMSTKLKNIMLLEKKIRFKKKNQIFSTFDSIFSPHRSYVKSTISGKILMHTIFPIGKVQGFAYAPLFPTMTFLHLFLFL